MVIRVEVMGGGGDMVEAMVEAMESGGDMGAITRFTEVLVAIGEDMEVGLKGAKRFQTQRTRKVRWRFRLSSFDRQFSRIKGICFLTEIFL